MSGSGGSVMVEKLGFGCSKLATSLVNVSLKFQTLISQICQYILSKKIGKAFQCIWL